MRTLTVFLTLAAAMAFASGCRVVDKLLGLNPPNTDHVHVQVGTYMAHNTLETYINAERQDPTKLLTDTTPVQDFWPLVPVDVQTYSSLPYHTGTIGVRTYSRELKKVSRQKCTWFRTDQIVRTSFGPEDFADPRIDLGCPQSFSLVGNPPSNQETTVP